MPNFLWTAKDNSGKTVAREITADTIEESKAILLAEGCTDLELKTDEIIDAIRERSANRIKISAEQRLKHLNNPSNTFSKLIFKIAAQDMWFHSLAILVLAFAVYRGHEAVAMITGISWGGWITAKIWLGLPSIRYARLNKAKDWYRWTEVLTLAEKLERMRSGYIAKLLPLEFPRVRAQALAGMGSYLKH
jgi:hypothetical protein